MKAVLLSRL